MELPLAIFSEGKQFFSDLGQKYKRHPKGLYIFTPSGAGKTYFCSQQAEPNWIDGDDLWIASGAQPEIEWWDGGVPMIEEVEKRCDIITQQAIHQGFWVMGSVTYGYKPDAIVIPDWETITRQISQRQNGSYDGGMTDAHHDQLRIHLGIIEKWHTDFGVPRFISVHEAVNYLTTDLS